MSAIVWSRDLCINLIREFRKRPVLWDPKNAMFYKKKMKAAAWIEIGDTLDIPPDSCTHKMGILLSSFRREKVKLKNSESVHWFAFEELAFLMDKDNETNRKSEAIHDEEVIGDASVDEETASSSSALHSVAVHPKIDKRKSVKRTSLDNARFVDKKSKLIIETDPVIRIPVQQSSHKAIQQPTTANDNEINFFSNFIASKMMKYSEATKNAVQQAICEIIFQADQNLFEPQWQREDPLTQSMVTDQPTSSFKISYSDDDDDD